MSLLFGTSGIRGSAEELFTNQFTFDLGRTFAQFLNLHHQTGQIALGNDPRPSSPRIKAAFAAGMIYENYSVVDQGITPVPSLNWLLLSADYCASAMITGSHIKADLNGIKFFAFKEEITKDHEKEIEEIYIKIKEQKPYQQMLPEIPQNRQAVLNYQKMLENLAKEPFSLIKIVIDPGNGAQTKVFSMVMQKLGCKIVEINSSLNEIFLARDTEQFNEFEQVKLKVVEEKADLGIAFDADGDRVLFIDHQGIIVPPDYIGAIIAKNLNVKSIVTPITTSAVIETIGKPVYRTKVGSPYVIGEMKVRNSDFGFEANGGVIFGNLMYTRDGGSPAIELLNILNKTQKSLKELKEELPNYYLFKDKTDCPKELEQTVIKKLISYFQAKTDKIEYLDGVKIWLSSNSWLLLRMSKNAPEFRVFCEDIDENQSRQIGNKALQLVKETIHYESKNR